MRRNILLTPIMVALVSGGTIVAQDNSAILTGRVTNAEGQPLQGVRVQISSPALLGPRTAQTDANGNFRALMLTTGEYTIVYTLEGYISRRLTTRLVAGTTGNASIRLTAVGAQVETIEVVGMESRAAHIDKTETISSTTYANEFLQSLAQTGGSLQGSLAAISALTPGLTYTHERGDGRQGAAFGLWAMPSIRGGTASGTKTFADGIVITKLNEGYVFRGGMRGLTDLVESVAVIQSPLNAKYGGTDGGIQTMTLAKGTNTFSGSIRVDLARQSMNWWGGHFVDSGWATDPTTFYPDRVGYTAPLENRRSTGIGERLVRTYEVTVKGPLWKDRLTFTYGARLLPATERLDRVDQRFWERENEGRNLDRDRRGIYYQATAPAIALQGGGVVGDTIRKAELFHFNNKDNRWPGLEENVYNTFSGYLQITPNHQLEYNYSQMNFETRNWGNWGAGQLDYDNDYDPVTGEKVHYWSLAYKGIVGNGVITARYGKNTNLFFEQPHTTNWPIRQFLMASSVPRDGNYGNHDLNNYWSNGLVSAYATEGNRGNFGLPSDYLFPYGIASDGTTANYNLASGLLSALHNGGDRSGLNTDSATTWMLNYQHLFTTSMGTHMIDIGADSAINTETRGGRGAPPWFPRTLGKISNTLSAADIYNAFGNTPAPASFYQGKYIVFNVMAASYNDVDPWAVSHLGIPNNTFYDASTHAIRAPFNGADNGLPSMTVRFGDSDGIFDSGWTSFFINDLWTINDHHSVMMGLRIDKVSFDEPSTGRSHSYTQPALRFQYKFDISGDNRRVAQVSFGQFHNVHPGIYMPLTMSALGGTHTMYWSAGTPQPYLVEREQLWNESNYTTLVTSNAANFVNLDKSLRNPMSTEITAGFTRNLDMGGFWKTTVVYRTWQNPLAQVASEVVDYTNPMGVTSKQLTRTLTNRDGYDRTYYGFELEWEIPLNRRVNFGGSYTFSRLMTNWLYEGLRSDGDGSGAWDTTSDWWWDQNVPGGRSAWAPVRLINPEHSANFYLRFDLSSGKLNSQLSFLGRYLSGTPGTTGFTYDYGLPYQQYPDLVNQTGAIGGTSGTAGLARSIAVPIDLYGTGSDDWDLHMAYNLEVPLVKNIRWYVSTMVYNVLNHKRYQQGLMGGGGRIVPYALSGTSPEPASNIWSYQGSPSVWRSNDTPATGYGTGRSAGRTITVTTGLRF